jgi:pyrophosphate--fructose-6-phosphate 1-phosphotransferase
LQNEENGKHQNIKFVMNSQSLLQRYRLKYQPGLPSLLRDLKSVVPIEESKKEQVVVSDPALRELFPFAIQQPIIAFKQGTSSHSKPLKVGVVLSGGQAPGGHNVITGLLDALKKLNSKSQLIGFLDGPSGIIKNKFIPLTEEGVAPYRNQGGFDIIGSGRTKIETPEQFEAALQTLKSHALDGLVIIGGDDSNTNAAFLAEFCHQRGILTRIVGVPKTIDGDLKNEFIEISFGFDTASKIYSEIIGNLLKDALSAKKYYFFIKMMGRSASHLTLECALQTHVNLALIGEEIAFRKQTLTQIVNEVADLICERAEKNKNFGVILIPEGLLEFIPECQGIIKELNGLLLTDSNFAKEFVQGDSTKRSALIQQHLSPVAATFFSGLPEEIQKQLLLDRDPHGNIQLSKIETERLIISLVDKELDHRKQQGIYKGQFNPQPLFCGYEGRSGLPSNFDSQYCYALGHVAALLIQFDASGYICCIKNLTHPIEKWQVGGVPIVNMLHFEIRKNKKQAVIQKALVDLEGPVFAIFKKERERWRLEDAYCCPGPIQFDGPHEITEMRPLTLLYE